LSLEGPWAPAEEGPKVRVVLLNFKGVIRHSWEANLVRSDDTMVTLRAVAARTLRFDEMTIDPGDSVMQYFPRNEWFYIQEYLSPAGQLKGWYCNVAAPPLVEGSTITVKDLIVDVFVWPNRNYKVLDIEELEERKNMVQPSVVQKIHEASEKLVLMIESRKPPFDGQRKQHTWKTLFCFGHPLIRNHEPCPGDDHRLRLYRPSWN
jgi:protein associated with RNAse G/E